MKFWEELLIQVTEVCWQNRKKYKWGNYAVVYILQMAPGCWQSHRRARWKFITLIRQQRLAVWITACVGGMERFPNDNFVISWNLKTIYTKILIKAYYSNDRQKCTSQRTEWNSRKLPKHAGSHPMIDASQCSDTIGCWYDGIPRLLTIRKCACTRAEPILDIRCYLSSTGGWKPMRWMKGCRGDIPLSTIVQFVQQCLVTNIHQIPLR